MSKERSLSFQSDRRARMDYCSLSREAPSNIEALGCDRASAQEWGVEGVSAEGFERAVTHYGANAEGHSWLISAL